MKLKSLVCLLAIFSFSTLTISCMAKKGSSSSGGSSSAPTGSGGSTGGGTTTGATTTALDAANNSVTTDNWGYLFPTTATADGSFGGATAGDALCATEATNLGLTGSFYAVVSISGTREPTSHWVLKPSTVYKRPDGTTIATTNASGTFDFPMANSITTASTIAWTGMLSDWSADPGNGGSADCGDWTYNISNAQGDVGDLSMTTSVAIVSTPVSCGSSHAILCTNKLKRVITVPTQQAYRRIFPTIAVKAPASPYVAYNTIANWFDAQCTADATTKNLNNDGYGTYKALVETSDNGGNNTRRFACTTVGCTNGTGEGVGWIMTTSTEYRREDATTVIGTTNSGGVFDFPMTNSFTGVHEEYWTGANPGWAIPNNGTGVTNCAAWSTTSGAGSASIGWGDATDSTAIDDQFTTATCAETHKILCVEQSHSASTHTDYPGYN